MSAYIIRRIMTAIPVVLIVSVGVFALTNLLPGDPLEALLGPEVSVTPQVEARMRQDLGLNDPLPVQYLHWAGRALHGDLGKSIQTHRSVTSTIAERLPVTIQLALAAWLLAIAISIPLGVVAALRRNTWLDHATTFVALGGVAVPSFWMGLMFILLFGVWLKLLPPSGFISLGSNPLDGLRHLLLPAVTLGLHQTGSLTRQTRSAMLDVLNQDYVRTARAKGLHVRRVVAVHALRNAMLPVLTVLGIQAGALIGGTVVIEQVFAIPGMGRLAVSSVFSQDLPVVQGVVLISAVAVLVANLLTDVAYSVLDPRIRYG